MALLIAAARTDAAASPILGASVASVALAGFALNAAPWTLLFVAPLPLLFLALHRRINHAEAGAEALQRSLTRAVERRMDVDGHSDRLVQLCESLASELALGAQARPHLLRAASVHSLGLAATGTDGVQGGAFTRGARFLTRPGMDATAARIAELADTDHRGSSPVSPDQRRSAAILAVASAYESASYRTGRTLRGHRAALALLERSGVHAADVLRALDRVAAPALRLVDGGNGLKAL